MDNEFPAPVADQDVAHVDAEHPASVASDAPLLDLVAVEADLADVETALARLEAGTYWTCEVTGQPLPDDLMAAEPTRRRLPSA